MTQPSKAAKAAALLCFTAGVPTTAKAVEIYNELSVCESEAQAVDIMGKHNATVWHAVQDLSMDEVWCQVEMLAKSIDACAAEFPAQPDVKERV